MRSQLCSGLLQRLLLLVLQFSYALFEIPNLAAGSVRNPSDFKTQLLELALFVFLRKKKPLEGTTQGLVVHTPRKKLFVVGGRIKGLTFVVCSLRWHLLAATRIQLLCS